MRTRPHDSRKNCAERRTRRNFTTWRNNREQPVALASTCSFYPITVSPSKIFISIWRSSLIISFTNIYTYYLCLKIIKNNFKRDLINFNLVAILKCKLSAINADVNKFVKTNKLNE